MQKLVKTFTCPVTKVVRKFTYKTHSIVNGIEKVEITYPNGVTTVQVTKADTVDPRKKMYLNPATGREVSYYRAKFLGII
jgi:hypothetical protein